MLVIPFRRNGFLFRVLVSMCFGEMCVRSVVFVILWQKLHICNVLLLKVLISWFTIRHYRLLLVVAFDLFFPERIGTCDIYNGIM